MRPDICQLERFFEPWEFQIRHVLCASDAEAYRIGDLLALADDEGERMWRDLSLGYTETAGHPALRREIARQYETLDEDHVIVCGGGAAEALFLLANALLGSPSHCVSVWPAYESLYKIPRATGARVSLVGLGADRGWALDLEQIAGAIEANTRAVFVNFPHNPTGVTVSRDALGQLAAWADEREMTLVSDEVYRELEFSPEDQLPAAVDLSVHGVSVGVLSKAYGLAGLRIGWIASRDDALLARIQQLKDYTSVCASAPSEVLAVIALRAKSVILENIRRLLAENLASVDVFMWKWAEVFEWHRPLGGTVAFPRLKPPLEVDHLVSEVAKEEGVLLLPGRVFDWDPSYFRIGFGRKDCPEALEKVSRYLERVLP